MSLDCREIGHRQTLIQRWKKFLASTALAAVVGTGVFLNLDAPALSGGETRTISIYHVHTKQSLTITYKKDGKYIPSAMKKLNYILRDWRRNETITISPKTIDLMWELHADLGSRRPVHIVSGYRSPKTNAFLKKIGRNVARKSQHMIGKAIDIYLPDVPTEKMRNYALVRKIGGVGYYRGGGGPTGFLHIDSGRVRHWGGPGISSSQMARIMRDYRKIVGARINKKGMAPVAETEVILADATAAKLPSQQDGGSAKSLKSKKKIPLETAYSEDDEELAGMSEDATQAPQKPKTEPAAAGELVADAAEGVVVKGYPVPKPRPKPIEVLMMAAVNMKIEPASAPPPGWSDGQKAARVVSDSIGAVEAAETMVEPTSNSGEKGSLTAEIMSGESSSVPVIRSITASVSGDDLFWWPQQLVFDTDKAIRRDGAPQQFGDSLVGLLPGIEEARADTSPQLPRLAVAALQAPASGKGDMQVVNREGKGSLLMSAPTLQKIKLGQLSRN